jgi:hypothetical protein
VCSRVYGRYSKVQYVILRDIDDSQREVDRERVSWWGQLRAYCSMHGISPGDWV